MTPGANQGKRAGKPRRLDKKRRNKRRKALGMEREEKRKSGEYFWKLTGKLAAREEEKSKNSGHQEGEIKENSQSLDKETSSIGEEKIVKDNEQFGVGDIEIDEVEHQWNPENSENIDDSQQKSLNTSSGYEDGEVTESLGEESICNEAAEESYLDKTKQMEIDPIDNGQVGAPENPESTEKICDTPSPKFNEDVPAGKSLNNAEQIGADQLDTGGFEAPESTGIICETPSLKVEHDVLVGESLMTEQIGADQFETGKLEGPLKHGQHETIGGLPSETLNHVDPMEVCEDNGPEGWKQSKVPESTDSKSAAGRAPQSVSKVWHNLQNLEDLDEEEPRMPKTPKKNNIDLQMEPKKTMGGIDDYVNYMKELKKNPPPPKESATSAKRNLTKTENVDFLKYKYEEAHLIRKSRNFLRGSQTVYENKKLSQCLIIQNSKPEDMDSMAADVENLTNLFRSLSYNVKLMENLTAGEIEECVKKFGAKSGHGDSVVVCFIAHGNVHGISGTDKNTFSSERVYHLLGPENAPELAGKPKIVIYENCRGTNQDSGYTFIEEPREPSITDRPARFSDAENIMDRSGKQVDKVDERASTIPKDSDFFLSFATTAGHFAYAHRTLGSFHVRALCQTMAQRAHCDDIAKIMMEVRRKLGQINILDEGGFAKQMPETRSTLTRAFYFNTVKKSEKALSKERRQKLLKPRFYTS